MIHEHVELPRLLLLTQLPKRELDLIVGLQAVLNLLERGQRGPRQQLGHIFDLRVCLQHQQGRLSDNQVNVDYLLLCLLGLRLVTCLILALRLISLSFVVWFDSDFVLLLARKDSARVVGEPSEHVVRQAQMEATHHLGLSHSRGIFWITDFGNLVLINCVLDKLGYGLNQIVKVHGGAPLRLILGKQVLEQVSSIGERRIAKLGLRHEEGRLERKLVPKQDVEVVLLNAV